MCCTFSFSLRLLFTLALLLMCLLLGLPVSHAASAYEGRWAENPATCRNTRAGNTDDLPIVITRRLIETFAASCRVLSVRRQSAARGTAWRLRTSCRDEGQTETEPRTLDTVVLRVSGNRLSMRDMNGSHSLVRCPR
jgi:hypothetical protein